MPVIIKSAPGKALICGEYAVLFGHPALCAPLSSRAYCRFQEGAGYSFSTPFIPKSLFEIEHGRIVTGAKHGKFYRMIIEAFNLWLSSGRPVLTGDYHFDTSELYERGRKLGIGASSGLLTSVFKVLFAQAGIPDEPNALLKMALEAYQAFSMKNGSGIDLACATFDRLISFQGCHKIMPIKPKLDSKHFCLVDTGKSQNTRSFIESINGFQKRDPNTLLEDMSLTNSARQQIEMGILENNWGNIIEGFRVHNEAMTQLGLHAKISIMSPQHQQIDRLSQKFHGAAKPSGAGGGDIAICAIPLENREPFRQALLQEDFTMLGVQLKW